jgi:hypothetical protein
LDHLHRNFSRISADAFGGHTVIGGHHEYHFARYCGSDVTGDARELNSKILQEA